MVDYNFNFTDASLALKTNLIKLNTSILHLLVDLHACICILLLSHLHAFINIYVFYLCHLHAFVNALNFLFGYLHTSVDAFALCNLHANTQLSLTNLDTDVLALSDMVLPRILSLSSFAFSFDDVHW